jgi:hypothetical protein
MKKTEALASVLQLPALASDCRHMARELQTPGVSGLGKMANIARAAAVLQLAGRAFEMMAREPSVHLVVGVCWDDSSRETQSWVQSVWARKEDANAMRDKLRLKARLAGAALGKPEMVGLTYEERSAIKDAVRDDDVEAVVGRQGLTWETKQWELG